MYKIGDIIKCQVTGFKEYGIFVKVDEEYSGLIHISQISESFVRKVTDYSEIGETIYASIIAIDEKNKHLKLSIKNTDYKHNGKNILDEAKNGFLPLKKHLNIWINEKVKELRGPNSKK